MKKSRFKIKKLLLGILVVVLVGGGFVGGVYYGWLRFGAPAMKQAVELSIKRDQEMLKDNKNMIIRDAEEEGYLKYVNKENGFSFNYPKGWRVEDNEDYVQILSYPEENQYNPGRGVPEKELKVEIYFVPDLDKTVNQWVGSIKEDENIKIIKRENFPLLYKGNAQKVFLRNEEFVDDYFITIYDVIDIFDNKKFGVRFECYPYNSIYYSEFEKIVKSFSLLY